MYTGIIGMIPTNMDSYFEILGKGWQRNIWEITCKTDRTQWQIGYI